MHTVDSATECLPVQHAHTSLQNKYCRENVDNFHKTVCTQSTVHWLRPAIIIRSISAPYFVRMCPDMRDSIS